MSKEESLISAYILDGTGGGRQVGWEEIKEWKAEQGLLWVHLNFTKAKTKQWLAKESKLDPLIVKALVAQESRPRTVSAKNGLLVCLRGVNLAPGEDPEDMVSIRLWIEPQRVISSRRRKLLSIKDLREAIDDGVGPKTSGELLTMLNDRLINRMADVLNAVDESVDDLEQEVMTAESYDIRPKLSEVRHQAILIRRYLAPQREALARFQIEDGSILTMMDKLNIREGADRIIRYIEDLDTARDRAGIIHEELVSRLSEKMEYRMYLLSVVTMLFLPLTFFTGLLGINVAGIPGADNPQAFLLVCGLLIFSTVFILSLFKRKKWI